jgi:hypothetical protein
MNKIFALSLIAACLFSLPARSQSVKDLWNTVKSNVPDPRSGTSSNSLSSTEVVRGLREALTIGAKNASGKLSVENGYFGNALVKVLMPPEAKKVENTLRQLGMGDLADKTILSMNRAAEDAATKAAPIFINAITSMSIQDGMNILRGGQGAATNFLKSRTTAQLTAAFRPVIEGSLNKLNVATYWNKTFFVYNQLPTTFNKVNPDLTAYVTERALQGLFLTIAEEENKIRNNPAARVTDLLKKVFGAK